MYICCALVGAIKDSYVSVCVCIHMYTHTHTHTHLHIFDFDEFYDRYKFNTSRPATKHLQCTVQIEKYC